MRGEKKSERISFGEGDDVIIGGSESEMVICGDAVDGVPSPGATSEEPPEQLERRGVMKEGNSDKETVGGGNSGINLVKKGGDGGDGDIGGGEDVICSSRGCSKKGLWPIASGKMKRIEEGVEGTQPAPKKAKYCLGCLAVEKDAKNWNRTIKRTQIKEEKEGLVLPKCVWVQKKTIVFDGDTLDIPFLNKDQYIIGTFSANFCNQFILLKKMIPGSTIKQACNNMNGITNPLGKAGGSYLTFGPEKFWEKSGARWLGVKGKYNPINSVIHRFLPAPPPSA